MKTMMLIILMATITPADDILLKDGTLYLNVKVTAVGEKKVVYEANDGKMRSLNRTIIEKIIEKPFDAQKETVISRTEMLNRRYSMPNLSLIAFSIPAAALAVDYFHQVADLGRSIHEMEDLGLDAYTLRNDRVYKIATGLALGGFCLYNTITAFKRIEIGAGAAGENGVGARIKLGW